MVKGIRVNRIGMKVYKEIGVSEWAFCNMVASLLPDCIVRIDIVSHWGTLPPPGILRQGIEIQC